MGQEYSATRACMPAPDRRYFSETLRYPCPAQTRRKATLRAGTEWFRDRPLAPVCFPFTLEAANPLPITEPTGGAQGEVRSLRLVFESRPTPASMLDRLNDGVAELASDTGSCIEVVLEGPIAEAIHVHMASGVTGKRIAAPRIEE